MVEKKVECKNILKNLTNVLSNSVIIRCQLILKITRKMEIFFIYSSISVSTDYCPLYSFLVLPKVRTEEALSRRVPSSRKNGI